MIVTLLDSFFIMPVSYLALETSLSLYKAHENSYVAIFLTGLSIWTGHWIGSALNARFLKFILRGSGKRLCSHFTTLSAFESVSKQHGFIAMLLLSLSPFYAIEFLKRLLIPLGISHKNYILGNFSAIVPIFFICSLGVLDIQSSEALESGNYDFPMWYVMYQVFGTLLAVLGGCGILTFKTVLQYRLLTKDKNHKSKNIKEKRSKSTSRSPSKKAVKNLKNSELEMQSSKETQQSQSKEVDKKGRDMRRARRIRNYIRSSDQSQSEDSQTSN